MNNATINTDNRTYLVRFSHSTTAYKFITTDLAQCIKANDKGRGIEYIKEFNVAKNTFKRLSMEDIARFHSWNIDAMEFFKYHYHFKGNKYFK